MTNIRNALMQAAGSASGDPIYVEDVFNTTLFTGNSGDNRDIVTGLDMSGEGGMLWFQTRSHGNAGEIYDTVRGVNKVLFASGTNAETTQSSSITDFNSDGFEISSNISANVINRESVGWSFRKKEGFFDVVTYTGTGSSKTVSHNLGCVPGMIIVKMTTTAGYKWRVWHKEMDNRKALCLNDDSAESDDGGSGGGWWNNTAPTSSVFSVGTYGQVNNNGDTFVAYLFADGASSDAQIFGDDGDEAIVKTGTFTSSSTWGIANAECGFEPQYVLYKRRDSTGDWFIVDNMRGCGTKQGKWNGTDDGTQYSSVSASNDQVLRANTDAAEANEGRADFYATGFSVAPGIGNAVFVYIAIRRGPMKEPTAGTDVYAGSLGGNSPMSFTAGFPVDMAILKRKSGSYPNFNWGRLFGDRLQTDDTAAITYGSSAFPLDSMTQTGDGWGSDDMAFMFRRYPKVFDVVVYKGNGSPSIGVRNGLNHNLGVAPELIIHKGIDTTTEWQVGATPVSKGGYLNLTNSFPTSFTPSNEFTATTFDVDGWISENGNNVVGEEYICYLFSSFDGISKVGSYSGTGNDVNVTGLGAAARFVLIKRTDATGDWYVYDSTRGIVSGNDPYIFFNNQDAEVTNTDYIDPHSSGFTITSSAPDALNASGGTYLYLAFA